FHESLLVSFAAAIRFHQYRLLMRRKQPERAMKALIQASDLAHQAANMPTIRPKAPYRYVARAASVWLDQALERDYASSKRPDPLPGRGKRWRANATLLSAEGRVHASTRAGVLPGLALALRPETARVLLEDWARDEPDNMAPLRLRAWI